ncbi:hypothetical protein Krac_10091 [Ktedonobacter racemifer DSM 44963]|uniref:Uncharacterized protein n=1 Tax=Ktedonobacter racemifer DSM 44963 TaxID=485913 RepID=D6TFD4_KTERA|nr:hypothetical protein Krac_10091 [Ktedonobacter racemifer DSM 44963]
MHPERNASQVEKNRRDKASSNLCFVSSFTHNLMYYSHCNNGKRHRIPRLFMAASQVRGPVARASLPLQAIRSFLAVYAPAIGSNS